MNQKEILAAARVLEDCIGKIYYAGYTNYEFPTAVSFTTANINNNHVLHEYIESCLKNVKLDNFDSEAEFKAISEGPLKERRKANLRSTSTEERVAKTYLLLCQVEHVHKPNVTYWAYAGNKKKLLEAKRGFEKQVIWPFMKDLNRYLEDCERRITARKELVENGMTLAGYLTEIASKLTKFMG